MGGIGFGFEGLFSATLGIDKIGVTAFEKYPTHLNLALFWSGPAFPLTLLIMGVMLAARKITPVWIALLIIVGAVAFPVSRILRIEWVAFCADTLLLIPMAVIGVKFLCAIKDNNTTSLPAVN